MADQEADEPTRTTARREEQRKKKEQQEQAAAASTSSWGWGSVWSAVSDLGARVADKVIDAIDTVDGSLGTPAAEGGSQASSTSGGSSNAVVPGSLSDVLRKAREENEQKHKLQSMLADARTEASSSSASIAGDGRSKSSGGGSTLSDLLREARENKEAGPKNDSGGSLFSSVTGTLRSVVERMKDEVHTTGLDELGRAIVETGVGALSSLVSEVEGDPNTSLNQSNLSAGPGDAGSTGFQSKFEQCMGMSHYEALQLLSQGLSAHLHQQLLQLSPDQYATIEGDIQHVVKYTHISEGSSVKAPEDGTDQNAEFEAILAAFLRLDNATQPRLEKLRELRDAAHSYMQMCSDNMTKKRPVLSAEEEDAEEESTETTEGSEEGGEKKARRSTDWMDGRAAIIHEQAIVCLAELTAVFVELLRRIAESTIVKATNIQEGEDPHTHTRDDIRMRASTLREICDKFVAELSHICHRFGELVLQATLLSQGVDAATADPVQSRTLATSLYLEGSAATAYVQESLQLMSPLLESLLLREAV